MSERKTPVAKGDKARADRLAEALRANLKRRKAQARTKAAAKKSPERPANGA